MFDLHGKPIRLSGRPARSLTCAQVRIVADCLHELVRSAAAKSGVVSPTSRSLLDECSELGMCSLKYSEGLRIAEKQLLFQLPAHGTIEEFLDLIVSSSFLNHLGMYNTAECSQILRLSHTSITIQSKHCTS